jgi:hypothetical protein
MVLEWSQVPGRAIEIVNRADCFSRVHAKAFRPQNQRLQVTLHVRIIPKEIDRC